MFRVLTKDELEPLENDFVIFLASNGISVENWNKIKNTDQEKVNELIGEFSSLVFFRIFSNKRYMSLESDDVILHFDFQANEVNIVKIVKKDPQLLAFSKRDYIKSREEDMFILSQQGGIFTDGLLYKEHITLWAGGKQ